MMGPIKEHQTCVECGESFYGLIRDCCTVACRDKHTKKHNATKVVRCRHCGTDISGQRRVYCNDRCRLDYTNDQIRDQRRAIREGKQG